MLPFLQVPPVINPVITQPQPNILDYANFGFACVVTIYTLVYITTALHSLLLEVKALRVEIAALTNNKDEGYRFLIEGLMAADRRERIDGK